MSRLRSRAARAAAGGLSVLLCGCNTPWEWAAPVVGTLVVGTIILGNAPTTQIEQVYYLGVFDPLEQVPPMVYRLTVRGQSSALSTTKFASGWVPAGLVDTLGTQIGFAEAGAVRATPSAELTPEALRTDRRLMAFGPEGFREVPRDYRLVIVMGTTPEAFFNAVDQTLGDVAKARVDTVDAETQRRIVRSMDQWASHQQRLDDLQADLSAVQVEGGR
jgi:hypothetical protein